MPVPYLFKKTLLISIWFGLVPFFIGGAAKGQPSENILWETIETKHTIIHYQSLSDLKKFNSRIKYRTEGSVFMRPFSSSGPKYLASKVSITVDVLFEKAQQLLDMRKKMEKVTLKIYNNKKQLQEAYQRIYGQPCHIRAWYENRFNCIFLSIDDMHEGMLAHEMAHGIIDHYLLVRPPPATAEILAQYVDRHLRE